jgi:hypothetical protein
MSITYNASSLATAPVDYGPLSPIPEMTDQ